MIDIECLYTTLFVQVVELKNVVLLGLQGVTSQLNVLLKDVEHMKRHCLKRV